MAAEVAVSIECGGRRCFAWALDWPGWCRSGRDQARALEALAQAAPRYAVVASDADVPFPVDPGPFGLVEQLAGSATTDFGAPGAVGERDRDPLTAEEAERAAALVEASWRRLDALVAGAPAELRKGPRGGGRDRDAIVAHVVEAEAAYARKMGIRLPTPDPFDPPAVARLRSAIADALAAARDGAPLTGKGWPPRYAARRVAWHALDHAWEIEDRSAPAPA